MPIEIRELVIKASVSSEEGSKKGGGKGATNQSDIVQQCVDQVLEVLKDKTDR